MAVILQTTFSIALNENFNFDKISMEEIDNKSAYFQMMACHLFGIKPSSEPMVTYISLDPWEQISEKFKSKYM